MRHLRRLKRKIKNIDLDTIIDLAIKAGTSIAVVLSWGMHKSILWATLHGILGWFYIAYYYLSHVKKMF